jgi:hypothetical protein
MISDEEHASVLSQNGIKQKLRQAWQLHRTFQRQAADWRQKHLQERAAELAQRQNTQQAKAVKAIKHREATKQRFSRIRRANGKLKRGLIQIEVKDPETRTLETLTKNVPYGGSYKSGQPGGSFTAGDCSTTRESSK